MESLIRQVVEMADPDRLFPPQDVKILIDQDYLAASCGVISKAYPQAAVKLLEDSINRTTGG